MTHDIQPSGHLLNEDDYWADDRRRQLPLFDKDNTSDDMWAIDTATYVGKEMPYSMKTDEYFTSIPSLHAPTVNESFVKDVLYSKVLEALALLEKQAAYGSHNFGQPQNDISAEAVLAVRANDKKGMAANEERKDQIQKNIRIPRPVHGALVAAAGMRGISATAYIVQAVREATRRDLDDRVIRQRLLAGIDGPVDDER